MWKFCPLCGLELRSQDGKIHGKCKNKHTWYKNPTPTTGVFVIEKNKILLTKRKYEPNKNDWDIPGGFMNINETPEEGIRREVMEEIGSELDNLKFLGLYGPTAYPYDGRIYYNLDIFYTADLRNPPKYQKDDVSEIGWFDLTHELPPIAFTSVTEAISDIRNKLDH